MTSFDDDTIYGDDPEVVVEAATGRLFYRGEPYTGLVVQRHPDGRWLELWSYDGGDRDGGWWGWYPDGTDRYSGDFYRNVPIGVWEEWYPSGRLRRIAKYDRENGLVSSVVYDEDGRTVEIWDELTVKGISREAVEKGDPELVIDPETGCAVYRGEPFTGELIERMWEGGPVAEATAYVDGELDGPIRDWYMDGSLRFSGEYTRGRETGTWRDYAPDGTLRRESVQVADGRLVSVRTWDETGALISSVGPPAPGHPSEDRRRDG